MNPAFSIQKLDLSHLDEYIRLRREGVRLDPVGFGKAHGTEAQAPRSLYASMLAPSSQRSIWGAFSASSLVGMVRLQAESDPARRVIYCLYVCPALRGHGIGRRLLGQAIREAMALPVVKVIELSVITQNEAALALYHSVGFQEYGVEETSFCVNGEVYTESRMRKTLRGRLARPVQELAGELVGCDGACR